MVSCSDRELILSWLCGLGVWFLLWVQEVPGSNPGWALTFASVWESTYYSVRPKTWPLFKNMPPPLCVSCRYIIFVSGRYIYVQYTTAVLLSYVEKCGQDEAFHMAISITLRQKRCKKYSSEKCGLFNNQSWYWYENSKYYETMYGAHFCNSKLFLEMPLHGCKIQFLKTR